jgi:hypothetical protein
MSRAVMLLALAAAAGGAYWWWRKNNYTYFVPSSGGQLPAIPTPMLDLSQPGAYTTPGINLLFDISSPQGTTKSILDYLAPSNAINSTAPGGVDFSVPYQSASAGDAAGYVMKAWTTPRVGEFVNGEKVIYDGFRWEPQFQDASIKYGIPAGVLSRLAWQESRYNPRAVSVVGARGMMQIMPATLPTIPIENLLDPNKAIYYAGSILRDNYRRFSDWPKAIVAYNQGGGNVNKAVAAATAAGKPYDWLNYPPIGKDGRGYIAIARDTGLWPTIINTTADRTA